MPVGDMRDIHGYREPHVVHYDEHGMACRMLLAPVRQPITDETSPFQRFMSGESMATVAEKLGMTREAVEDAVRRRE